MLDGLQILIQFVDQRNTGGDVEFGDVLFADAVEVHDQRAQAVAVGADQYLPAGLNGGHDFVEPVGQKPRHGLLERFGAGQLVRVDPGVTRIVVGQSVVAFGQGRRGNIVTAPPNLHLVGAVLFDGFGFVESLQVAVMPLVQPPRMIHRNPHQIHRVKGDPQRADGALEH